MSNPEIILKDDSSQSCTSKLEAEYNELESYSILQNPLLKNKVMQHGSDASMQFCKYLYRVSAGWLHLQDIYKDIAYISFSIERWGCFKLIDLKVA